MGMLLTNDLWELYLYCDPSMQELKRWRPILTHSKSAISVPQVDLSGRPELIQSCTFMDDLLVVSMVSAIQAPNLKTNQKEKRMKEYP